MHRARSAVANLNLAVANVALPDIGKAFDASQTALNPDKQQVTDSVQSQLQKSFASARGIVEQHPQYASQIIAAAKSSFLGYQAEDAPATGAFIRSG